LIASEHLGDVEADPKPAQAHKALPMPDVPAAVGQVVATFIRKKRMDEMNDPFEELRRKLEGSGGTSARTTPSMEDQPIPTDSNDEFQRVSVEKWEWLGDRALMAIFAALLDADGQESGVPLEPFASDIHELSEEVGEALRERELVERVPRDE
jgi:hypothetical protein